MAARTQDLDWVANQLPKLHANFFFQLDPAVYQQAVANLQANLAGMTTAEFYVALAGLVTMAGDAHTFISLSGPTPSETIGFHQFPLTFRWLDDGVFVTGAAAPYAQTIGTQLVGVGDYSIDTTVARLGTMISHENDQWLHYEAQDYLSCQQVLQGLHLLPTDATSPLTFRTLGGDEFTLAVTADGSEQVSAPDPAAGPLPDHLFNSQANYWYSFSATNRLVYFKYNVCGDDPANPIAGVAARIGTTLDANPVDTVVFDFRGNTGGDSSVFAPVALAVVGRFPKLLANPNFRFYDAIDKGTFSSGMDDADAFKQPVPPGYGISFDLASVTTVVGEPTGGKPEHYGEVKGFTLPGSHLNGQYSTRFFSQPDGIPLGLSFAPDITVNTRSTDYFARYDPVMGAILARSRGAPLAPSGDVITLNAASLRPEQGVAAESLAAARGAFAQVPDQVIVSGQLAPIVNATTSRVDFIVPGLVAGPAAISVLADGVELAAGQFTISAAGPGIFVRDATDPTQPGMIANENQSANGSANRAGAGSVIHITATGYGPLDAGGNAPVAVYFGDTPARVAGSGPVADSPGIWQIDVQVPVGVSGQVPLYIVTGDLASNAVTVWVN